MQEATTCNIFNDGTSFQHLATVLISLFTLCYGSGLIFVAHPVYSDEICETKVLFVYRLQGWRTGVHFSLLVTNACLDLLVWGTRYLLCKRYWILLPFELTLGNRSQFVLSLPHIPNYYLLYLLMNFLTRVSGVFHDLKLRLSFARTDVGVTESPNRTEVYVAPLSSPWCGVEHV